MTTLGKILAIVNLVLSLAVGAFIVMSYVARTNWHAAYADVNQQLKAAQADTTAYKDETLNAQKTITTLSAAVQAKDLEVRNAQQQADRRVAAAEAKFQLERDKAGQHQVNRETLSAELDRRQDEVKYLKGMVSKRDTQLTEMEKQVQTFRDKAVESDIFAKAMAQRNESLLVQLEHEAKTRRKTEQGGATPRQGVVEHNPPAEPVNGKITEVDETGLVKISVGTDAGVNAGNTLQVFRLDPEPAYLGTIQILIAKPNESVGRRHTKSGLPLKVGDKVASNLMDNHLSGNPATK